MGKCNLFNETLRGRQYALARGGNASLKTKTKTAEETTELNAFKNSAKFIRPIFKILHQPITLTCWFLVFWFLLFRMWLNMLWRIKQVGCQALYLQSDEKCRIRPIESSEKSFIQIRGGFLTDKISQKWQSEMRNSDKLLFPVLLYVEYTMR